GRVAEAVAVVGVVQGGVEEEDAVGQRVAEIRGARVEDAVAVRAEAAEGHAEGKAQVIRGRLGVEGFDVSGERRALGAIDRGLGPFLGVAPGRGAGALEFY